MRACPGVRCLLLAAGMLLVLLSPRIALAQDVPTWPSEQEQRLKEVDTQLLDVQRQRFAALFGKDKESTKQLEQKFSELQKERRQLLRATGRLP